MLHKSKAASGSVDMSSKTNVPASNNRMFNWTALLLAFQTVQLLHFSTFINFKNHLLFQNFFIDILYSVLIKNVIPVTMRYQKPHKMRNDGQKTKKNKIEF